MLHKEYFGKWYDSVLNSLPFCIDDQHIKSFGLALGFIENGKLHLIPRITANDSQYYNALLFIRLTWPFGCFFHVRLCSKRLFQCGIGYKLTGRFAVHCRVQTDESSAKGYHAGLPNNNQATGYNYGAH